MTPLVRNMSCAPRTFIDVRPATVAAEAVAFAIRLPSGNGPVAARLLALLGETAGPDPLARLRERLDAEAARLGLTGCALVRPAGKTRPRLVAPVPLAILVLARSSETIFVARKSPALDHAAYERILVSRDPRFVPHAEARP